MKWFEFYEVMRRQQEIKDKERESAQARTHKKTRTRHG